MELAGSENRRTHEGRVSRIDKRGVTSPEKIKKKWSGDEEYAIDARAHSSASSTCAVEGGG